MNHETITILNCELNAEAKDDCIVLHNGQVIKFNEEIHKEVQLRLRLAEIVKERHQRAVEKWDEGEVVEYRVEDDGTFCIRYENGRWWHYKNVLSGKMEWWQESSNMILQFEVPEEKENNIRRAILKILIENGCSGIKINWNPYPDTSYYEEKDIKIPSFMNKNERIGRHTCLRP